MIKRQTPVILCILDGWGIRPPARDNAITNARTPNWNRLLKNWPHTQLQASAEHVGLPAGQMGNSEVGHMNLGAGRVVPQTLPRINAAITEGTLSQNLRINNLCHNLKEKQGTCHLMGLLSPGGVHSHQDHLLALARLIASKDVPVKVHAFLDGRDTPPQSAIPFIKEFEDACGRQLPIQIATVTGRYYAMDRDRRWERTEAAYQALVEAKGIAADSALQAVEQAYTKETTDEFIKPTIIGDYAGIRDGDGLLMANFRADRARQLLSALCGPDFKGFVRQTRPKLNINLGLVEYSTQLNEYMPPIFSPIQLQHTLGAVVSEYGFNQLRAAETEKYAHVTFFFNGGREPHFTGEDRLLVPSPKVSTYDHQPEMSALPLTNQLIEAMERKVYDLVVVNYANTDMVGHTGNQNATMKAVETVDRCLGKLEKWILEKKGLLIITADHGNAEIMQDPKTGKAHTAHTCQPVPCMLIGNGYKYTQLKPGVLADVAPTILHLMGLEIPRVMTGKSVVSGQWSEDRDQRSENKNQ
ncbi:MAG: 2,3-bisphosphoglycerate-independent phosphoglycerate mutase [Pseudomonadota bacterium]